MAGNLSVTPFRDIEMAGIDWLKTTFPELADPATGEVDFHVGNQPPGTTLQARLPFVVFTRMGGSDAFFTDHPLVSVDVFGPDRQTAYHLSEAIRARLLAPLLVMSGVVIDKAETRSAPQKAPWDGDRTWRFRATYEFSIRR